MAFAEVGLINGPAAAPLLSPPHATVPVLEGAVIQWTPTINTGIYAGGDSLGEGFIVSGIVVPDRFKNAILDDITAFDINLWLFNAAPTAPTNNAAVNCSAADIAKLIGGPLQLPKEVFVSPNAPTVSPATSKSYGQDSKLGRKIRIIGGQLWGILQIAAGTPTFTDVDRLRLQVLLSFKASDNISSDAGGT
jgi:hypothetical protein